jgi:predicted MFS family arabinose efflux permease
VGGLVGLVAQTPAGMLVDWARSERTVAAVAVLAIATSALIYVALPVFPAILTAAVLHALASSVLGPVIAAISLGLVGHAGIAARLGRNARFASIGNGFAAALMGTIGVFFAARSVFIVTALLIVPTLFALRRISAREIIPQQAHGGPDQDRPTTPLTVLLRQRPLIALGCCVGLFHLANAAMLPLMASALTSRFNEDWATGLTAACIVVPQLVVALIAPTVGRLAETWSPRPLLALGFSALIVRGVLFATADHPAVIVAAQVLDGISAAALGVIVPLMVANITRGTGRFNSALGVMGTIAGGAAALSMTLAGVMTDTVNTQFAFFGLSALAVVAVMTAVLFAPRTKPKP